MKLIKINTDHYIIVDDSKIQEGDMIYLLYGNTPSTKQGGIARCEFPDANNLGTVWKKITHSTPNVGGFSALLIAGVKEMSLQEVKELIGEVDVYSKKFEYLKKINEEIKHKSQDERIWIYGACDLGFTAGYNQSLEDNKERKYTEEDVRKAIEFGHTSYTPFADVHYSNFIQSLQPETEWEVEFIDGELKLK